MKSRTLTSLLQIIYLEAYDNKDLIVLQPQWLCSDMIGYLLSHDQQARARATGVYTVDDFQRLMVEGDAALILKVLEELQFGVQCNDNGEEPAYEFPCLNSLSRLPGIWERKVPAEAWTYGGVRLACPVNERSAAQLVHVFPRVQVQLRHNYLHLRANRSTFDCSLLQWHWGSKFCHGKMECLITFEQGQGQPVVDIVLRGPVGQERQLYAFLENVFECVTGVLEDVCPGFRVERHVLSVADLKSHADNIRSYSPRDVLYAHLLDQCEVRAADDSTAEQLVDLLFFGSDALISLLTFGTELHTSHLPAFTRRQLSALLDVPDPMGRDWCLLAVLLGLSNVLPNLDRSIRGTFSKTDHILYMWSSNASASIRQLIAKLEELQRQDAVDVVLYGIPLCVIKSSLRISSAAKLNRVAAKYNAGYGTGNRL
jgi:death-associated protein kinase